MTIPLSTLKYSMLSLAVALSAAATTSYSQEKMALEEVLVSAQIRSQSLQDVPLAITAVDGQMLLH